MKLLVALVVVAQAPIAAADQVPIRHPIRHDPRPRIDVEIASELTAELRKVSPLDYIQIDVAVAEPNAPTHRLTRKSAAGLAQRWHRLLADGKRAVVRCMPLQGIVCLQLPREGDSAEPGLILEFCRDPELRLAAVTTVKTTEDARVMLASQMKRASKACAR